jgi:hypothetical protein
MKKTMPYLMASIIGFLSLKNDANAQSAWTNKGPGTVDKGTEARLKAQGYTVSNVTVYSYNADPDSTQVMVAAAKTQSAENAQDSAFLTLAGGQVLRKLSLSSFGRNTKAFDSLKLSRARFGKVLQASGNELPLEQPVVIFFRNNETTIESDLLQNRKETPVAADKKFTYVLGMLK